MNHSIVRVAIYLLLFLSAIFLVPAFAAGPSMMAGFPLRTGDNVLLMWVYSSEVMTYNVYRSETTGGPYKKIAVVSTNYYTDISVPTDKSFYYVIKAILDGTERGTSSEVVLKAEDLMTRPVKFIGILVTPDNKISMKWESNPKATAYNIYRSFEKYGNYKYISTVQSTVFTDNTVVHGIDYYYKVTAISANGIESPMAPLPEYLELLREPM